MWLLAAFILFLVYLVWIVEPCIRSDGHHRCHWALTCLIVTVEMLPILVLVNLSGTLRLTSLTTYGASFLLVSLPLILLARNPPLPSHIAERCDRPKLGVGLVAAVSAWLLLFGFAFSSSPSIPSEVRFEGAVMAAASLLGLVLLIVYLIRASKQHYENEGPGSLSKDSNAD